MPFMATNFNSLVGTSGFSSRLLNDHFSLYKNYVSQANQLEQMLRVFCSDGKTEASQFHLIERRFSRAINAVKLHELYFGSIFKIGGVADPDSRLFKKLCADLGAYEDWEKSFTSVALTDGDGWAVLFYDLFTDKLFNAWVDGHDLELFPGAHPLLVLDVYTHAYAVEYGSEKSSYIQAFLRAIDWETCEKRFRLATAVAEPQACQFETNSRHGIEYRLSQMAAILKDAISCYQNNLLSHDKWRRRHF